MSTKYYILSIKYQNPLIFSINYYYTFNNTIKFNILKKFNWKIFTITKSEYNLIFKYHNSNNSKNNNALIINKIIFIN